VWRLQQFIVFFEVLRIMNSSDLVQWLQGVSANVESDALAGWLGAVMVLPSHPFFLIACVAAMRFITPFVAKRELRRRERLKAAAARAAQA
jgi:hypothetical protein